MHFQSSPKLAFPTPDFWVITAILHFSPFRFSVGPVKMYSYALASNATVTLLGQSIDQQIEKMKIAKEHRSTRFSLKKEEPTNVRPAIKTPDGLYFLSNLDHAYPYPIEIVMSFKGDGITRECQVTLLKEALSKVLVEYFPTAGRLTLDKDGKMTAICTGEGVPFVEAMSENDMEVLGDLSVMDPTKLRQLVHYVSNVHNILDVPMFTVQVTKFKCGGIIVGLTMNHVLMDGKSLVNFLIHWSEVSRGKKSPIRSFMGRSLLSARQPPIVDIPHPEYAVKPSMTELIPLDSPMHLTYKSICFTPDLISQLKKAASQNNCVVVPTTFVVISAFIWILRSKAYGIKPNEMTKLLIAVDGRRVFEPPMPEGFFGNGIVFPCAKCLGCDLFEKPFSFAVQLVHRAIKEVTDSFIRSAIDYLEGTKASLEMENTCIITKWSRLSFYEVDFGWGKPMQVAPTSTQENLVVGLSQNKNNDSIVMSLALPYDLAETFDELILSQLNHIGYVEKQGYLMI